jgi:beta-phosphoglucomutase-like phosphatase (HAD superfamily)
MTQLSPKTKALLWDLDGTIIDSFVVFTSLLIKMAPKYGLPVPVLETMQENFHGTLSDSINSTFGGELKGKRLNDFVVEFLEYQQTILAKPEEHLLDDALALARLATKKGLKQIIVTNRDHEGRGHASPRNIVANSSLKGHIHEIICGEDAPVRKPHPDVLGDLLERWSISAEELVIIGDQYVDAQLAINLGSKAIIVIRDGNDLAHAHKLDANWRQHVTVVQSLHDVTV